MIPKQREIINNNKINNKKNIKVLILGAKDEGIGARFNIDIWNIVKSKLEKDGYKITETVIRNPNYTKEIENFTKKGYDMVVGFISVLYSRSKFGNYTHPIILDQFVIGFEPKDAYKLSYAYQIGKNIGLALTLFLILAILLSLILYFMGNHYSSKGNRFKWHFWGVFGALLGEPGSIVERLDILNSANIGISIFILLFMFIISLLFEAMLTQQVVEDDISAEKDPIGTDIKGQKFFVSKGTSFVEGVKTEGGIPIEIDVGYNKIQDHYLKNKDKASGFIIDAASWGDLERSGKYETLVKSQFQFPYDETAWLVEPNNYILLDKIQQILRKLHEDKTIRKLCLEKMPYLEVINCGI